MRLKSTSIIDNISTYTLTQRSKIIIKEGTAALSNNRVLGISHWLTGDMVTKEYPAR
jgi:hypothetical protein